MCFRSGQLVPLRDGSNNDRDWRQQVRQVSPPPTSQHPPPQFHRNSSFGGSVLPVLDVPIPVMLQRQQRQQLWECVCDEVECS
jgi:hypothetical protein